MRALTLWWLAAIALCAAGCNQSDDGPIARTRPAERPLPPKPAFLDKTLEELEKPIEAALAADEARVVETQKKLRWDRKREPLIPTGPELVGWKPGFDEVAEYRQRAITAYEKQSADPAAARPAALEFLKAYVAIAVNQRGDAQKSAELADAAVAAGSQDPIVVAFRTRARSIIEKMSSSEVVKILREQQAKWAGRDYPPHSVKFLASAWIAAEAAKGSLADAPMPFMRRVAYGQAAKVLAADSGRVSPDVLLWFVKNSLAFDKESSEQRLELFQACLSDPAIDPWIVHVVGGQFYRKLAWDHRGGGWASEVSPDGWKKFYEYLPKATKHYRRAWSLHPELPEPASEMIHVAMAGGDSRWSEDDWFHVALLAQADYDQAYSHYFFANTPRWGGSPRRIAAIAELCIASDRWDLQIPNKVGHALHTLHADNAPNELAGKNPAAAQIAKRYIDSFVAAHERGEVEPAHYGERLAQMAAILVTAGDFDAARLAFEVSPKENGWWWGSGLGVPYRYSEGLTYAMTGPARGAVEEVHEFLTRPATTQPTVTEVEDLQARLKEARDEDSEARAKPFFEIAGRMLQQLHTYANGEWVDLTFEPGLSMWLTRCWQSEIIDERTIRLVGDRNAGLIQLKPLTRFAPPFIVEAEVKPISAHYGGVKTGITIGTDEVKTTKQRPAPQSIAAGEAIWGIMGPRELRNLPGVMQFEPGPLPEDGFLHLAMRRYAGETQYFAMHSRMGDEVDADEPLTDFLSFGDVGRGNATKEAVFRNLRIRKAPPKAKPVNWERPDSLLALREAVDFYPECPDARTRLAQALMLQGQPEDALDQLEVARNVSPKIRDMNRVHGCALCSIGNFKEASEALAKEIQFFSFQHWARVHLAWVLATAPDDSVRNGSLANQQLTGLSEEMGDQGRSWSYLLTAAVVAAELGDFEEARRLAAEAEEATSLDSRKARVARIRKVIDEARPYRMPAGGGVPPPPATRAKPKDDKA